MGPSLNWVLGPKVQSFEDFPVQAYFLLCSSSFIFILMLMIGILYIFQKIILIFSPDQRVVPKMDSKSTIEISG